MKPTRGWILAAFLGTFSAGVSVGIAAQTLQAVLGAGDGERDHDADYVTMLSDKYGLPAQQRRQLAIVVAAGRREELAVLEEAAAAQLPPTLQGQLLAVRNRTHQRIRALLNAEQAARYDRDTSTASAAHR